MGGAYGVSGRGLWSGWVGLMEWVGGAYGVGRWGLLSGWVGCFLSSIKSTIASCSQYVLKLVVRSTL